MFLSEWCEFPSAPRLARGGGIDDSSRLDVVEIARVPDMLPSFFSFLVGLRSYHHPGTSAVLLTLTPVPNNALCDRPHGLSS